MKKRYIRWLWLTFKIPPNSKRYPGWKSCILPVKTEKYLKEAKRNKNLMASKFETIEDLHS